MQMTDLEASHHVLLVEDDIRLANSTREYLEGNGYCVSLEHRGDTAVDRIRHDLPDLVILDLMLPGLDGHEVCKNVRPAYCGPILMLTARDDDMDQVIGLEIGADDYVIKPVVPRILLARIRALLRHDQRVSDSALSTNHHSATFGKLHIDYSNRNITLDGSTIICTEVEFQLLWVLASHAGQILDREFLYRTLNGHDYDGIDRSIDIRISRLRKKFEKNLVSPARIKTVRGKGYVFIDTAWN